MNRAKVILLCVLAACGYGVVHDQITVRVCKEYLSVAHPPIFPTGSSTLLALYWGIAATWWVGLALGVVLANVSHAGPREPESAASLYRSVLVLLGMMGLAAFFAGALGYTLVTGGLARVPAVVSMMVSPGKEARFVAAWCAHVTSYLVGLAGGAFVCFQVWRRRGRPAAIALWPRSRKGIIRTGVIVLAGASVWWWRGR